jgi:hypothetical protein
MKDKKHFTVSACVLKDPSGRIRKNKDLPTVEFSSLLGVEFGKTMFLRENGGKCSDKIAVTPVCKELRK